MDRSMKAIRSSSQCLVSLASLNYIPEDALIWRSRAHSLQFSTIIICRRMLEFEKQR